MLKCATERVIACGRQLPCIVPLFDRRLPTATRASPRSQRRLHYVCSLVLLLDELIVVLFNTFIIAWKVDVRRNNKDLACYCLWSSISSFAFVSSFVCRFSPSLAFTRSIGSSVDHRVSNGAAISLQLDVTHLEHDIRFGFLFYLGHNIWSFLLRCLLLPCFVLQTPCQWLRKSRRSLASSVNCQ